MQKLFKLNKINLSSGHVSSDGKTLIGCVLAKEGPAGNHFIKGDDGKKYQVFADIQTLQMWAELGNKASNLYVNLNHSHEVGNKIGYLNNLRVNGNVLLGDITFAPVAFTDSVSKFGEYAISVAKNSDFAFLNLSLETYSDYMLDSNDKYAYLRPTSLMGVSFVDEGALTSALFKFSKHSGEKMTEQAKPNKELIKLEEAETADGNVDNKVPDQQKQPEDKKEPQDSSPATGDSEDGTPDLHAAIHKLIDFSTYMLDAHKEAMESADKRHKELMGMLKDHMDKMDAADAVQSDSDAAADDSDKPDSTADAQADGSKIPHKNKLSKAVEKLEKAMPAKIKTVQVLADIPISGKKGESKEDAEELSDEELLSKENFNKPGFYKKNKKAIMAAMTRAGNSKP